MAADCKFRAIRTKRACVRLTLLLALLVGGAFVNVAVAWGCIYANPYLFNYRFTQHRSSPNIDQWQAIDMGFPNGPKRVENFWGTQSYGFGEIQTHAKMDWHDRENNYKFYEAHGWGYRAGWPMLALVGWQRSVNDVDASVSVLVWINLDNELVATFPYSPIWPGFAINTVFYAALIWMLFAVPAALRRKRRRSRGLCVKCAYDLRGRAVSSDVCPECGARVAARPWASS